MNGPGSPFDTGMISGCIGIRIQDYHALKSPGIKSANCTRMSAKKSRNARFRSTCFYYRVTRTIKG